MTPPWLAPSPLAPLLAAQRPWREAASLVRSPVWRGEGVADGRGRPVMVLPGFLAGDPSLAMLRAWLQRNGWWTCRSQIRFNVDCTRTSVERLGRRLVEITDRMGVPAAIVGQSRGGTLAKLVAMRHPDRVAGIVALGSPNLDPMAINPVIAGQVRAVAALGTVGAPGFFRDDCIHGSCADEVAGWLSAPFPEDVPYLAVFSRNDWVVDWRACLDPAAEQVEIDSSHIGMGVHRDVYELLAERLPAFHR